MKLKEQLAGLLAALQADDSARFLELLRDHVDRKEGVDLEELLQALQRKDTVAVCLGLKHQAELGVELFSSVGAAAEGEEGQEAEESEQQAQGAEVLYAAAVLAKLLLAQNKESPPEALQQAAQLLHDHALLAAVGYTFLQDEVARLCLEWWQAELPGREVLSPQTVPYLLMKALATGTAADVKRFHSMRTALQLFDFDDPSIADLKRLLLQAAFAPSFLRCAEGRRTIAYMFNLQPAFVAELTAIVKNQIPGGRKSVLDEYGEIIYRAWSTCTGACLLNVQQNCIQALMEAAILASTPAMAASLRRVLHGLHSQKHQPGVDRMLLELYEPILFRRLSAANPDVRRNALNLLVDAFPLRDPDESNADTDKRLSDQFAHLTALLKDAVPEVRKAAVAGVCRVLNEFWELIPGTVTASYIKLMAGELAFDASSPAVRAAVAEGLATLVDNPLARPLLKVVLPQLKPLLCDAATKVRIAMADLLLGLRGCEELKWHDVVPVEELLEIMAVDTAAVSERIQRLLLPTFFPGPEAGPATVAALLRASPSAGRAFCQYLVGTYQPEGREVAITSAGPAVHESQIVALIRVLCDHLLSVPIAAAGAPAQGGSGSGGRGSKKGRSKRKKAHAAEGEEEGEETESEITETPESWEAVLQGVAALACGLAALEAAGRCAEEDATRNLFLSGTLVKLLERCPSVGARQAVMAIAAALPALDASQEVRGRCLKHLLAGDYSTSLAAEQADELRGAVECICASDQARNRLLSVLVSSLHGDPAEVLEGLLAGQSAPGAAEGEEAEPAEEEAGPQRAKRAGGGKKADPAPAAARAGGKKKGKRAAEEDEEQEEEEETGVVDESLACEECGSRARGHEMLLCDNCDAAYHMGCLDPPVAELPEGDWFCPGCDAMMSAGMGADLAIRCLGLLLEVEEQRVQLVWSGALARLLPYVELALQERVDALKQALASDSCEEGAEGQGSASAALVVYMKACLHLFLAGHDGKAGGGGLLPGLSSTSMISQAAECTQQAVDWAGALVQLLARLDAEAILHAVEGNRAAMPEAKRSKGSKKKGAAAAASSVEGPAAAAAVKEAFLCVHTCLLLLAEAARVQALTWAATPASVGAPLARAACGLGQQFLSVVGSMAAAAAASQAGGGTAPEADDVAAAVVANVARLARNVAAAARGAGGSTTRDLAPAMQQAQHAADSDQGSLTTGQGSGAAGGPQGDAAGGAGPAAEALVSDLLSLACQDSTSALVVAALKPGLAGLLAALCGSDPGPCGGQAPAGGSSCSSSWLRPVAELLGRGIDDLEEVPAVGRAEPGPGEAAEPQGEPRDENAAAAANPPEQAPDAGEPPAQAGKAGGAADLSRFASEHAQHALVKQLLASAKLAKVQQPLAGCAAEVALVSFEEGAVRCTLGALELATLLGFQGVTARGKSRAGPGTYPGALAALRQLKDGVCALQEEELTEGRALLHHRLQALFPPAPRVTFGAV